MDKEIPHTWTESYVLSNRTECLEYLQGLNSVALESVRHEYYLMASLCLEEITKGLMIMSIGGCGNFNVHILASGACWVSVAAFGLGDNESNLKEQKAKTMEMMEKVAEVDEIDKNTMNALRAEMKSMNLNVRGIALAFWENIGGLLGNEAAAEINSMITDFKSKPLTQLKEKYDPDFPQAAIDTLTNLDGMLSDPSSFTPSSSNPSKRSSGCYIATAVYGSYDCQQVWTLRRYRDNILASTWYGRMFIHTYYTISPTLVKCFGQTAWFQKLWRGRLDHMIKKLNAKGIENTPYEDKMW